MPQVVLWVFPDDLVGFLDGIRRGEPPEGRIAEAGSGRENARPAFGRADEGPADGRVELKASVRSIN